jgi:hypothetical protein
MSDRIKIANSIITGRQQNRKYEDELLNLLQNVLVAEEDGVYRVLDHEIDIVKDRSERIKEVKIKSAEQASPEKGYLVISPRQNETEQKEGTPVPRHLALKVDNNKFWTISAIKGGTELEIGILENGEHRAVISFNEDSALSLKKELKLGAGFQAIGEDGKLRGIPTSGLKGFEEGRLYASGQWESTKVKIPSNTFGKYRLQAWLIQPHQNRYSHLETVFIFFPEKHPIQKVKSPSVTNTSIGRLSAKIESWWTEKVLNRFVEDSQGQWNAKLAAKVSKETGEIMIKCQTIIDPDRKHIYYTVERLWEGEYWAEDKAEDSL